MAFETLADVVESIPRFVDGVYCPKTTLSSRLCQPRPIWEATLPADGQFSRL